MRARVAAPIAAVREEPDAPIGVGEVYSQRRFGDLVTTGEIHDKHIHVSYAGGAGWMRRSYLEPVEATLIQPTFIVSVAVAEVFATDRTTLRQRLPFGVRLAAIDHNDDWISFTSIRGETGFARREAFELIAEVKYSPEDALCRLQNFYGSPYLWGGITPYGVDCTGLVIAIAEFYGHDVLPHSTGRQSKMNTTIERSDAQTMDLFYFPGHVAIYLGDDRIMHSNTLHGGVSLDSIDPNAPDYNPVIEDLTVIKRFPLN